jgi:uncharacterized protein with HEPN domain
MHKDDWIYIEHMLEVSRKAINAIHGKDRRAFDEDYILQMGLTHLIQIIGESANRVSPQFQHAHPEVPWHRVVGTRHRIVHDYMNVDEDVVWEVVVNDLPALTILLENLIPPEEQSQK